MINTLIGQKYKIIKKTNVGAFGQIFKALNTKDGAYATIKLQKLTQKNSHIIHEFNILLHLNEDSSITDKGIPRVFFCGVQGQSNIEILQYLGHSLQNYFKSNSQRFSLKTTLMIADQIIKRLEYMHNKKIIHRNIKPQNFAVGSDKKSKKIYLTNFQFSKKYISHNQHIKYLDNKNIIGTPRFISLNVHLHIQPTRRDDLQSLFFCLVYFIKGELPWQNVIGNSFEDKLQKILAKKVQYRPQLLCKNLPQQFLQFINHIRSLQFEQKPNYQLLKNLIKNCFQRNNLEYDFNYDWVVKEEQKNTFQQNKE